MEKSDSIIIIPTYNEKENIENIIRAVFGLEKFFHILTIEIQRGQLHRLPCHILRGYRRPLLAGAGTQRHEERRLHPVEQRSREGHHRHRGLRYEVPRLMNFRKRPAEAGLF